MGLNDQAKALNNRSGRKSIFKDGIRSKNISGAGQHAFRILPAFHPQSADPGTSWIPSIDENGNLTDWANMVQVVKFVGHGKGGAGSRLDLLSLKTFATDREDRWDPLTHLYQYIQQDSAAWGYLLKDVGEKNDPNKIRAAFGRPSSMLVANILDLSQSTAGTILGVFSQSAATSLLDRKSGLVYQPNAMPGIEEFIKKNYIYAYANGDITDPNQGPILVCYRQDDKGDFSAYKIVVYVDQKGQIARRQLDQQQMAGRVNLSRYDDYLLIPTEEELVQSLVQLLNGRAPMGYHEHALLKLAFPQFKIPEPPTAPGAMATVATGFAPSPGAAGIPGMPPSVMPGGAIPTTPLAFPGGPILTMPAATPGQMGGTPNYTIPAIPGMPPAHAVPVVTSGYIAPASTASIPAMATPAQPVAEVRSAAANMAAATAPAVPGAAPVVPGDPVAFNEADFMSRIRAVGQPAVK